MMARTTATTTTMLATRPAIEMVTSGREAAEG